MPKIPSLPILLALSCPLSGLAATVTFDFEASSNVATVTGTGVSSGSLVEGGSGSPASNAVYARLTSTTGSPADTSMVRGYRPDRVSDTVASVSGSASYVQFTLIPDAGQTLDFSSATLSFILGAASSHSSGNIVSSARAGFQINSGSWAQLGSGTTSATAQYNAATPNWTSATGYTTTATYDVTEATANISLASAITGLNQGDTVTIRIAIGDNSTVNDITTSNNVKSLYLDNISVSGMNVVPEPTAAVFSFLGLGLAAFRRKR